MARYKFLKLTLFGMGGGVVKTTPPRKNPK